MKTVRLTEKNVVAEIIPEYALPAVKWYGEEFAAQCAEAPDEVEQNWVYEPSTDTWNPPMSESTPAPTAMDRLEAQVAYTAMMTDTLLTEG